MLGLQGQRFGMVGGVCRIAAPHQKSLAGGIFGQNGCVLWYRYTTNQYLAQRVVKRRGRLFFRDHKRKTSASKVLKFFDLHRLLLQHCVCRHASV